MENLFDNLDFNLDDEEQIDITAANQAEVEDSTNLEMGEEVEIDSNSESSESEEGTETDEKDSIDLSEFIDNDETDETTEIDEPSSTESSSSPYNTFALALSEEGLISLQENETVKSFDDLKKIMARTIKENEFAGLTENQKILLESIRNGIPEDTVVKSLKTVEQYNNIDSSKLEEDEELRLTLITQDFLAKGFDKAKADKLAKRSVELGEDLEDSIEALSNLKTYEKEKIKSLNEQRVKEEQLLEQQYKDNLVKIKDTIQKTESIIPGIPMNSRTKDEVFENMTAIAGYDQQGNPLNALGVALQKNREDVELKINYLFTVTKGLTDFSALKATTKSNVLKELENSLQSTQLGSGKTKSSRAIQSSTLKGTLDAIDTLKL